MSLKLPTKPGMKPEEIERLYRLFKAFDKDNNDTIIVDEFLSEIEKLGFKSRMAPIFDRISKIAHHTKTLNFIQYLDYVCYDALNPDFSSKTKLREIFDLLTGGADVITVETIALLSETSTVDTSTTLSMNEIHNIIEKVHLNHDSKIDFIEFCNLMQDMDSY